MTSTQSTRITNELSHTRHAFQNSHVVRHATCKRKAKTNKQKILVLKSTPCARSHATNAKIEIIMPDHTLRARSHATYRIKHHETRKKMNSKYFVCFSAYYLDYILCHLPGYMSRHVPDDVQKKISVFQACTKIEYVRTYVITR